MTTDKKVNNEILPPRRTRRSPTASRENILAAAETILTERGPQHLKLADVAAAAHVASATVLHHFTSIDGLQAALMEHMVTCLADKVLAQIGEPNAGPESNLFGLQTLFDAFEEHGAARLAAWLVLTGEASRLKVVRRAVNEVIRRNQLRFGDFMTPEAMENIITASITCALGAGLFGQTLSHLLGRPPQTARDAVQNLLIAHTAFPTS